MIQNAKLAVLQILSSCLGSMVLGYAVFGDKIFDPQLTYYQFLVFSVIAGVFVAAMREGNWRLLVPLGVVACLGVVYLTKSNTPVRLARDVAGVLAVMAAVWLGLQSNRAFPALKIGKFVIWSAIFSATHTCAVFFLILITEHSTQANPEFLLINARIGVLIGAGVGLGVEFLEIVASRALRTAPYPR